ncbi:MAG: hypothetical protein ACLQU1_08710 [Bryobacteraceae bacterium]
MRLLQRGNELDFHTVRKIAPQVGIGATGKLSFRFETPRSKDLGP